MDRAVAELERGQRALDAQHHALRRVHVLQRRRHRTSAPTRASSRRSAIAKATSRRDTRSFRQGFFSRLRTFIITDYQADRRGRADLPAGLARRRHGRALELVHAVSLRERPRAERRPDVPAAAVRLRGAGEPVAAVSALQRRRLRGPGSGLRELAPGPRRDAEPHGDDQPDDSPGARRDRLAPVAPRGRRGGREPVALHRERGAPARHVHVHRAPLRARSSASTSRPIAIRRSTSARCQSTAAPTPGRRSSPTN